MMSRCPPAHQALTATRTVYIGRAAPHSTYEGLESIQKPLCELYRKSKWNPKKVFDHMESTLHVFSSGLLMKPCNPLDKDVWFKIQDLDSCLAVKAYNDPSCRGRLLFVPVDSGTAGLSEHPPMFALVMKRSNGGVKISDCHAFVCSSDMAALTLVRATAHAFSNPSRWTDERPTLVQLGLERPEVKFDNECYVDDVKDDCTAEYYDKPKLSGFFYTPRSDLIQKYSVKGEDMFGRPIGEGPEMIQPFTCDEFEPPPRVVERPSPAPPQTAVIVLQNGNNCCPQQSSCQGSWEETRGRSSSKKDKRKTNHYVQQSEIARPPVQPYTDQNGDQYLVDAQPCQTGCSDPIYSKFLPHTNGVAPQQAQMYAQSAQYVEYHGQPQNVEYVEYHGNGQRNNDIYQYTQRLPGQGSMGKGGSGRNYDGNFILKKDNGYGMPGGYGINIGALSIGDHY